MIEAAEYDDRTVVIEDVTSKHATDAAVLVVVDGEEMWIPLSQVHDDSEIYKSGDEGRLIITKWIAKQKGLWED